MSSLRRTQSSKANGALSKGPVTPEGKHRSSQNAIIHGLLADSIVLEDESRENFLALVQQHVDRFQPADEVEFGMIEEMCAARWRQRRAWAIETRLFETQIARPADGDSLDRMADAVDFMAAAPGLSLIHRYETRLHIMYQRALNNLITLRKVKAPNEPSPISEHPPEASPNTPEDVIPPLQQAADSEPPVNELLSNESLGSASFSLHPLPPRPPIPAYAPAHPPAAKAAAPPRTKQSGGAM